MIRRGIITIALFLIAPTLPRVGPFPDPVPGAIAAVESSGRTELFAQNQADSESATGGKIDLEERQRSRFRYLMLGYGLIWLTLGGYLLSLNRRIGQVGQEVGELAGRLEESKRNETRRSR